MGSLYVINLQVIKKYFISFNFKIFQEVLEEMATLSEKHEEDVRDLNDTTRESSWFMSKSWGQYSDWNFSMFRGDYMVIKINA